MPDIKDRIKELRKKYGYTQESLAKALGLNAKSSIANYENGSNAPSDEIKLKMCKLFNCSMDYLMGLVSHKNPKEELEKELYSFNLTEEEYCEAINCFLNDNIIGLGFMIFYGGFEETRENKIIKTILRFILDYVPDKNMINDLGEQEFFERKLEKNLQLGKKMLISLDKNKIIHNYQDNNNINKQFYMCPVYGRISAGQPNWAEECIEGRIPIDPELMNIVNPEECFFLRVNGESMNKIVKNGAYALIRKTDFVENGEIAVVLVNGYDATLKKFSRQGDLVILEPQSTDSSYETQVYGKETEVKIIGKYIGKMEMK